MAWRAGEEMRRPRRPGAATDLEFLTGSNELFFILMKRDDAYELLRFMDRQASQQAAPRPDRLQLISLKV
jgi:hypothetical protein